ncbi:restriction endonuclease [Rhodobacterales bacterium HKCCE2091]|nr:restriction endonuclease [Rhodobacterales bacterium HKCCE2091]
MALSSLDTSVAALASRIREYSETIQTEEAVKTSVVLPFLQALGYDVFNPAEVIPEFTADTPGKKGEKVDYAIQRDGEMMLLIECKGLSTQLTDKHIGQLLRYFTVTSTRFALLTNGREYRFFTDLEHPNRMDHKPFFIFDILEYSQASLAELNKFSRSEFSVEAILAQAERLKYVSAAKRLLSGWFDTPPESFVKLVANEIYEGQFRGPARDMLANVVVAAIKEIVREKLQTRISSALADPEVVEEAVEGPVPESEIETTHEELEGFLMVKALLRGEVDTNRIAIRDAKSYCAVLLDDNNRKPLARLHFNRSQKYIGLFDGENEEKVAINSLDEMLGLKERLVETAKKYG